MKINKKNSLKTKKNINRDIRTNKKFLRNLKCLDKNNPFLKLIENNTIVLKSHLIILNHATDEWVGRIRNKKWVRKIRRMKRGRF